MPADLSNMPLLQNFLSESKIDLDFLRSALVSSLTPAIEVKDALQTAKSAFDEMFFRGTDIRDLILIKSQLMDHLLSALWNRFLFNDDVSLVAVGGYGRGELHPHSDTDLLILVKTEISDDLGETLSAFITLLWDLNLDIGHSVRTVEECILSAKEDVTICTNLLETRTISGLDSLLQSVSSRVYSDEVHTSKSYFLAKREEQDAPETKDNDFTWKDFQARNNNELVAIFGNFINRVVVLTNKYYNGIVPNPSEFTEIDEDVLAAVKEFPNTIGKSIERYRFREASQELMNLARLGNKYLADEEPWKVIKVDEERVKTIMFVALQISAALAVLAEPFLPFTSTKLKNILNVSSSDSTEENCIENSWKDISEKSVLLPENHQINKAELLFSKIEDKTIELQLEKLAATKIANASASSAQAKKVEPQKETIEFDDFTKLDVRIGTILEAEKVAKTKKLLKLKVDVGIDTRTIVSGIAESFSPEDIIGQQVSVLVNLAPRKIRGVESQGMILMTDTPNGKLAFVEPNKEVKNGQQVS